MRISSLVLLAIFLLGARCEASQVGVVHQLANAKHPTLRLLQGGSADAGCRPLGVACYGDSECCSLTCAGPNPGFCMPTRDELLNPP
ncbi:unnamed protein product [Vitrella brassicaformis CCMP3155]|uniref:Uncharacterized protein n=1 Tax=Vitrella brassicaformis (strain CCMP3155) TaxID=1169540 RepID=A0A0G4H5S8_VITBC|nr:unnamed protein product [Vitrella brassicaformis CCMP3155]|eukprot:CEM39175.1 unnamed protein product [Vitrella brassicaformis CCMP3155]